MHLQQTQLTSCNWCCYIWVCIEILVIVRAETRVGKIYPPSLVSKPCDIFMTGPKQFFGDLKEFSTIVELISWKFCVIHHNFIFLSIINDINYVMEKNKKHKCKSVKHTFLLQLGKHSFLLLLSYFHLPICFAYFHAHLAKFVSLSFLQFWFSSSFIADTKQLTWEYSDMPQTVTFKLMSLSTIHFLSS